MLPVLLTVNIAVVVNIFRKVIHKVVNCSTQHNISVVVMIFLKVIRKIFGCFTNSISVITFFFSEPQIGKFIINPV